MKAYVVYPTYRIIQDEETGKERALVYLFGRLENGESFLSISHFRPYFWIKSSDLKKAKDMQSAFGFEVGNEEWKNFNGELTAKIVLDTPKQVKPLRELFEDKKIKCYEANVRFEYRFLMDHDILGSVDITGKFKKGDYLNRIYENPVFKPAHWVPKLGMLSIDIETDPKARTLYALSMHTKGYSHVFVVSDKKWKNATSFPNEKDLLIAFRDKVKKLDPDIITGWNVVGFDLKVLQELFRKHKIDFFLGRADWTSTLRLYNDFFRESTADVAGRQVLDGIAVLKSSFITLDDYKLGTAAEHFLGEKKLIGDDNKGKQITDAYKKNTQLLIDYNLKDSVLAYKIMEKSGALGLTIQRTLLTGMPLERVRASVASLDSLYLRELRKKKIVANSMHGDRDVPTKGGFVMKSKPGIYNYILVHDFKSLYPSIMRTFNIDPYSYLGVNKKGDCKEVVKAVNKACFRNEEGILPSLIQRLWEQRDNAKKEKNDLASHAIKILMNSFYGVLANENCRFYSPDIANAITHTGQYLIKLTAEKVEELGYEVIYGDTDSIFTDSGAKDAKEAEKIGKKIQDHINKFYQEYIKENYCRPCFMELEFEKIFKKFMMPTVRGSKVGAKKRYAGLVLRSGKEKLEFTGLEFVRSDWTDLSKKFQLELLDKIFHEKEVAKFIQTFVTDLKKGKYDDLLVYRKSIRKDLSEYTKTTPPHVKAARKLELSGKKIDSTIIRYIMTENGPEPIQIQKSPIDYEHYIEKQIKPLADSVLSFYATDFNDVIQGSKQKTLFGY
ncbi:MAG: DNA polymerase II [Nanoarchaeota archaeon]|nr:DNA polymerase II [Nanoarchaeota archaeon]